MESKFNTLICRSDSSKSRSPDVFASPVSQDKTGNSGAIVKSSNELAKTTPAGEYLTSALMDFDPDQFEGFVAIVDGANKLLMLVISTIPTYNIITGFTIPFVVATKLVLLLPLYCPRLPLYGSCTQSDQWVQTSNPASSFPGSECPPISNPASSFPDMTCSKICLRTSSTLGLAPMLH
jgi:hypothetical protein